MISGGRTSRRVENWLFRRMRYCFSTALWDARALEGGGDEGDGVEVRFGFILGLGLEVEVEVEEALPLGVVVLRS